MKSSITNSNRIWEIDFIRGVAIILMIIFHLIVDLKDFYTYPVEYLKGFWYVEGKSSAILFMLISGVSSTLGNNSTRHGFKIFTWAMILTAVTYLYNPRDYILFGILHFLGISLLSANFMRRLPIAWLLVISSATIIIGILFSQRFVTNPYLFPLGLMTNTFISLDYYPLFPWYGIFVSGIALGKIAYGHKKRLGLSQVSSIKLKSLTNLESVNFFKLIAYLGQHSLAIYLIHQPVLLALLYVFYLF